MFHYVTGVPFESKYVDLATLPILARAEAVLLYSLTTGGAYDDLTLWEQIDAGAQYTPSKKWLTSVPIFL